MLFSQLQTPPAADARLPAPGDDPMWGDDSALALYCCYELHYRSFEDVDARWEWEPSLLAVRQQLEAAFERRLRDELGLLPTARTDHDVIRVLETLASSDGPSLSSYLETRGSLDELREFAIHRSAYQLKEADPHTWAIPRLHGRSKAALVAIQDDEYGRGIPGRLHSDLFARTLQALDLDDTYGTYMDDLPGSTLATVNLMSFLGLHQRLRGAIVGHLALFEMTSVTPMARYARTFRRLHVGDGAEFFDVHAHVDGDHEAIALELCTSLLVDEPALASDIVFGACALDLLERRFAGHLMDRWSEGRSSLVDSVWRIAG